MNIVHALHTKHTFSMLQLFYKFLIKKELNSKIIVVDL